MGAQDTYWTKACIQLGLPYYLIEEHVLCKKCCTSPVTLFLAARKQRLYISQSSGVFSRLGRKGEYPDNVAIAITKTESDTIAQVRNQPYRTVSMGHGYVLEIVYSSGPPIPTCCSSHHSLALLGRIKDRTIHKICECSPEIHANSTLIKSVPNHHCFVTMSSCILPEYNEDRIMPAHQQQNAPVQHSLIHRLDFAKRDQPVESHSTCSRCSLIHGQGNHCS